MTGMPQAGRQNLFIMLLIVISGICGGSVYPLIKIAESHAIPKFAYIFWESVIITILLSVLAYALKRGLPKLSAWPYYVFCACTNIVIPQSLFFVIAQHLDSSIMSLIVTLTPIFVYVLLVTLFAERFILHKAVAVVMGFLGVAILLMPSIIGQAIGPELSVFWLFFSLLLPLNYSVNRIYATRLKPVGSDSYGLAIGLFTIVAVLAGLLMIAFGQFYVPMRSFNSGDIALLAHAVLMSIFYVIFFILADQGVMQNTIGFYLTPIIGAIWGVAYFNEVLNLSFVLATAFVFAAIHILHRREDGAA